MNLTSARLSERLLRDAGPPLPKLAAGRFLLASSGLLILLVLAFTLFGLRENHTGVSHEDPALLLGVFRLALALPFLLLFGVVVGASKGTPRVTTFALGSMTGLLTLWMVFEAASSIHGEVPGDEYVELVINALMVMAILATLYYGSKAAQQLATRELKARERDPLTGLLNRQGIQAFFEQATSPVTLLMLDLNGLKTVNDTAGHAAGDARLRAAAEALCAALPPGGEAGRWGGDEFVAVSAGCSVVEALELVSRLNGALPRTHPSLPTFSSGAVTVPAGSPFERALALADAEMHECKARQHEHAGRTTGGQAVRTIEEFTAAIEQLDDPEVIARTGLETARHLLGFELAVYYRRRGDQLELVSYSGSVLPELKPRLKYAFQNLSATGIGGLSGKAVQLGRTVWESDYTNCPDALPGLRDLGLKSVIVTPIVSAEGTEGTFGFMQFRSWHPITPSVRWVAEALVMRMGHALKERRAVEEVRRTLEGGLLGLGLALEHRDLETAGHTERVVALAAQLGEALGLSPSELEALRQGAYLHDIGKLAVPDAVLLKPGKLTDCEWETMRAHSAKGFEIAARIPTLSREALEVIRHHHERWDGLGYPDGLVGDAVPLVARIFAVCDVFDALTSQRPYKRAWTQAEALFEIGAQAGRQFDPHVARVFLEMTQRAPD